MSFKQHETSDVNNVDPFEVKAVQSYKARKKGELSFKTDQIIVVTKSNVKEMMYFGTLDGKEGWFPYFYVKSVFSKPERAQKQEEHHNPIQHVANKFTGSKRKERVKKDAVLKSGMLGKQMDSNSGMYKQRWCVLRPQKLSYYRSASDPKSLGKVSVKTFKSVDYDATASKESKLFCFTIVTKKKENLTFACKRNEECDDWIKKIKQVISDTGHGSIRRPNTGSGLKFKFDSWSAPRKPSPKKSIADVIPQENNNNKVSPPSSPPVAPLPRTSRLQRQLTLKKLQQKLVTSTETENFLKRIERIKPSYDVNSAPSCDDIELESIVIPPEQYVGRVRANYNYIGKSEFELTFRTNDEILLLSKAEKKGWMFGLFDHREGYFPKSYVSVLEMTEAETPKPLRRKNTISSEETTKKKEKLVSLLENFQIGERIGKGQYGSVYRGINVDNGEMVAIKQVEIVKMKKKEIQLIMGELELLKEMNHTNILGYKTFIRTNEHINIVLDLVEGGSLASILGKFGVIPEKLAICYIKQILDGLEYLHTRDVIHRDIKCGNILVTKDGSVKLADFGIAMKLGDPSAPAVGSPYWMAPEVIEMRGSSSACDIWALGCTIIELLTGQPPYFEFNQVQAMFCMVENERPPFPQNISPEMESFLDKCFQRDPSKRPTAKQLKKHRLVRSPDEDSEDELDITSIEGLGDLDLAALQDLQNFGDTFGNLDGFNQKDFSGANFQALLDNLSTQLENEAEADENSSGGDVDPANFVKEEDLRFLQEDEKAQKLLSAFHDAMDKKKVDLAIRTRKSVRNYLKELKEIEATDSRFEILVQQAAMALDRCEDEMGQYIPVDSDEDSL